MVGMGRERLAELHERPRAVSEICYAVRATPRGDRPKGLASRGDPKSEYINPSC